MMQELTLKIQNCDRSLLELAEKIKEIKTERKNLIAKKRVAQTALNKFKDALDRVASLVEEYGEEFKQSAITYFQDAFIPPVQQPTANRQEPTTNNFYSWQPTDNPYIGSFFNLQTGKIHCTYLGTDTKAIANKLATKIRTWFKGISLEIREAKRLDSKYELKVNGFSDADIKWLVEQDFGKIHFWQNPNISLKMVDTTNPCVKTLIDTTNKQVATYLNCQTDFLAKLLASKLRKDYEFKVEIVKNSSKLNSNFELRVEGLSQDEIDWFINQDFRAIATWGDLFAVTPEVVKEVSLAASLNRDLLKPGLKVYCPGDRKEYELRNWGDFRAEVYDKESNQTYKRYLTNLEIADYCQVI